jgi:hypothetical protein
MNGTDIRFYAKCRTCMFIWPGRETKEEAEADAAGALEDRGHLLIHNDVGPLHLTHSEVVGGDTK